MVAVLGGALLPASAPAATRHPAHVRAYQARPHRRQAHATIIGGTLAEPGSFPWLAFIEDKTSAGRSWCTGTVVAPNVVLTAGHCVQDVATGELYAPSGYVVATGSVDWTAPPVQVSSVSRAVVYPNFNRNYMTGDAGLLILSTPTTAPMIPLATYPTDAPRLEAGTGGWIAGWGDTGPGQVEPQPWLNYARTALQSVLYCTNHASPFYYGEEFCTIDPPNDETGACFGDSGGPLIVSNPSGGYMELGVVSHVFNECSAELPSVFTRADLISRWVSEWIALANPPPPPSLPPAPTPPPPPAPTPAPAPFVPPNTPGYYRTRASRVRKVVVHVSGDGSHIVGMSIKMPVNCQHGYYWQLEDSWLSYIDTLLIEGHIAHTTLELAADRESNKGTIGVSLDFTGSRVLEGRIHVHVPFRSRRVGLCSGTLTFTAKR
jgi:hypothetical protein